MSLLREIHNTSLCGYFCQTHPPLRRIKCNASSTGGDPEMICVSVLYANATGKRFNHDYYAQRHMPMALDRLAHHGMSRYEIDRGLAGAERKNPPAYLCIGRLYFGALVGFEQGLRNIGRSLWRTFQITRMPKWCCKSAKPPEPTRPAVARKNSKVTPSLAQCA
jgi:uncharacterized protein (TIGR02118 family)